MKRTTNSLQSKLSHGTDDNHTQVFHQVHETLSVITTFMKKKMSQIGFSGVLPWEIPGGPTAGTRGESEIHSEMDPAVILSMSRHMAKISRQSSQRHTRHTKDRERCHSPDDMRTEAHHPRDWPRKDRERCHSPDDMRTDAHHPKEWSVGGWGKCPTPRRTAGSDWGGNSDYRSILPRDTPVRPLPSKHRSSKKVHSPLPRKASNNRDRHRYSRNISPDNRARIRSTGRAGTREDRRGRYPGRISSSSNDRSRGRRSRSRSPTNRAKGCDTSTKKVSQPCKQRTRRPFIDYASDSSTDSWVGKDRKSRLKRRFHPAGKAAVNKYSDDYLSDSSCNKDSWLYEETPRKDVNTSVDTQVKTVDSNSTGKTLFDSDDSTSGHSPFRDLSPYPQSMDEMEWNEKYLAPSGDAQCTRWSSDEGYQHPTSVSDDTLRYKHSASINDDTPRHNHSASVSDDTSRHNHSSSVSDDTPSHNHSASVSDDTLRYNHSASVNYDTLRYNHSASVRDDTLRHNHSTNGADSPLPHVSQAMITNRISHKTKDKLHSQSSNTHRKDIRNSKDTYVHTLSSKGICNKQVPNTDTLRNKENQSDVPNTEKLKDTFSESVDVPNTEKQKDTFSESIDVPNTEKQKDTFTKSVGLPNTEKQKDTFTKSAKINTDRSKKKKIQPKSEELAHKEEEKSQRLLGHKKKHKRGNYVHHSTVTWSSRFHLNY